MPEGEIIDLQDIYGPGLSRIGNDTGSTDLGRIFSEIPVGVGGPAVQQQGAQLSILDEPTNTAGGTQNPSEIDRRDQPSDEAKLPVNVDNWFDFDKYKKMGVYVRHVPSGTVSGGTLTTSQSLPTASGVMTQMQTSTKKGGSMDLGDLLGQVTTGLIDYQLAKVGGGTTNLYQPALGPPAALDLPFIDIVKDGSCLKRRRRRRPIVTNAEIGQLQGLTSVLKGDNLKVFLAKRVRS